MKAVLIDNWTIEKAISNFQDNSNVYPTELQRILRLLVLWDNVCYLDNGSASWWKECIYYDDNLKILESLVPIKSNIEITDAAKDIYEELYSDKYTSLVAQGAMEYLLSATDNDLSYVPVYERADFVKENDLYRKQMKIVYDRNDIIANVDKDIWNYYKKIDDLMIKTQLHIEVDSLFEEMSTEVSDFSDIVDKMKEMRNSKVVKWFRKWATSFENDIRQGKVYQIKEYKEELEEMQHKKMNVSDYSLSILPVPSLSVGISIPLTTKNPGLIFPYQLYKNGTKRKLNYMYNNLDN